MSTRVLNSYLLSSQKYSEYAEIASEWHQDAVDRIRYLSDDPESSLHQKLHDCKELCSLISKNLQSMQPTREAMVCLDPLKRCQGMMIVDKDPSFLEIAYFTTNPQNIGASVEAVRGAGTVLTMDLFEKAAHANKDVHVFSSKSALEFYQKRGFTFDGLGDGMITNQRIQELYPQFLRLTKRSK